MRKTSAGRDSTQKAIRDAAAMMISRYGYHAVTLRKLAQEIGIQAGSLYNHITNKQELLAEILSDIMTDLLASFERMVADAKTPIERLDIFIDNHIDFHTARKEEVYIGNMELRNLSPENFQAIAAMRDKYQAYLSSILMDGRDDGAFEFQNLNMTAFAIFGMLNAVSSWFNPRGRFSPGEVAAHYRFLIHRMLSVKG